MGFQRTMAEGVSYWNLATQKYPYQQEAHPSMGPLLTVASQDLAVHLAGSSTEESALPTHFTAFVTAGRPW